MGIESKIEWTQITWNPWQGCRKVSDGCKNCYMFRDKKRWGQDGSNIHRSGKATFNMPAKLKESRMIFVCSWSDFFLEEADEWRDEAWEIIRQNKQHIYQIPTKRIERAKDNLPKFWNEIYDRVWIGTSIENQETADQRIPHLLQITAGVNFLSIEPLLGPIDLDKLYCPECGEVGGYLGDNLGYAPCDYCDGNSILGGPSVDWVIVGGESGHKSRKMNSDWVSNLRDQCTNNYIPFFFKQWGGNRKVDGAWGGNELDGKVWQEMPEEVQ